jgi:hypothetical protein
MAVLFFSLASKLSPHACMAALVVVVWWWCAGAYCSGKEGARTSTLNHQQ